MVKIGIRIRELGGNYASSELHKVSIFDVFKALYNEKGITSFLTCNFSEVLGIAEENNRNILNPE